MEWDELLSHPNHSRISGFSHSHGANPALPDPSPTPSGYFYPGAGEKLLPNPEAPESGRKEEQSSLLPTHTSLGWLREKPGMRIWDLGGADGPAQIPGALLRAKSREKIQKYGGESTERLRSGRVTFISC